MANNSTYINELPGTAIAAKARKAGGFKSPSRPSKIPLRQIKEEYRKRLSDLNQKEKFK